MNWNRRRCFAIWIALILALPCIFSIDAADAKEGRELMNPKARTSLPDWQKDWNIQDKGGVYALRQGDFIRIGNAHLERVFRLLQGTIATTQIVNKVSGHQPDSQQWTEFALQLAGRVEGDVTAADFKLTDITQHATDQALQIAFVLQHRTEPALRVEIVVETYPERKYQRKWLEFQYVGDGDVTIKQLDVERTGGLGWWYIGNPTNSGMGQPLFVSDFFLGLEYPAGETSPAFIRHFPGRSAKGGLISKPAIWGVARDATSVQKAFFDDYLYTLEGVRRAEPFVIWNMLGLGTPEEKKLMAGAEDITAKAKKAGFHVDSFAIDDPWADYSTVWQPDPLRFPKGMGPLSQKIQSLDSRLGLWLSVMGLGLDPHWAQGRELEIANIADRNTGGQYCLAGTHYKAAIIKTLTDYVKRDKVNYFKCDYNVFECNSAMHGHPTGPAGREAQIDAYIDILKSVKATDPNCRIAITSNMWLSPWWVQYADWVWLGGLDGDIAKVRNLTQQDGATTYRDTVMYDDYIEKKYVFPYANVMTHGFWETDGSAYEKYQDDVIMTIGRGITKWEILNSPASMDEKRWAFLGRAMKWGRDNWDILSDSRMILGNPGKGEIYGYSHIGKGSALVVLRNPDLESKLLDLPLQKIGLTADDGLLKTKGLTACEIYPAFREIDWDGSAAIKLPLLGSQTKVIAIIGDQKMLERLKL